MAHNLWIGLFWQGRFYLRIWFRKMGFFSELPWKKGSRETNIDKALLSLVSVEKYLMALNPLGNSAFFNYYQTSIM